MTWVALILEWIGWGAVGMALYHILPVWWFIFVAGAATLFVGWAIGESI
jgi:hypothetical protein